MTSEVSNILPENGKAPKTFKSTVGIALSCLGAAVGTGNIWRYPRIVANNTGDDGALAFLLVWLLFLFTWSIPLLLVEYGTGRYTRTAAIVSFRKMIGPKSMWCGAFIGFVSFAIASYYAVICGWCAYYFIYYIANPLPENLEASKELFRFFSEDTLFPVLLQAIVIAFGGVCVFAGVRSIEPAMMIMVPVLLVIMLSSFIYALTLPSASVGISHLFTMDWEVFASPNTWIDALTQNAWDTGAAQGILLVYATYLGREHGVVRYGTVIPSINNLLSLLMAITLFATVFSTQIARDPTMTVQTILTSFTFNGPANTGLTFIWIPLLYSTLSIGRGITVIFFFCLFLAGFSSQVSLIEASCHQLVDMKMPRKFAVPSICILMFLLGLGSSLNVHFLVNQDFVWGSAIVLSGSMILYLVLGFGVSKFRRDIINNFGDGSDWYLPRIWEWIMWGLIPIQVVGLLIWWIVTRVRDTENVWYKFEEQSLMSALVQWVISIMLLVLLNFLYLRYADKILPRMYIVTGSSMFTVSGSVGDAQNDCHLELETLDIGENSTSQRNGLPGSSKQEN
ncbi:putative sodium-dependent transporter YocR [Clavelina lepadiformis]|uniref:Sodium-dependent transporter n=1 Tax=Clavelina lepadiformis TaxID=159417 RepID=A0ABP0GH70_CLALP